VSPLYLQIIVAISLGVVLPLLLMVLAFTL